MLRWFRNFTIVLLLVFLFSARTSLAQITVLPQDTDGDGIKDQQELTIYHTDPNNPDTDKDGFSDGNEIANGYSPLQPGKKMVEVDTDHDGLNDDWEIKLGTDLNNPDTDGDGIPDGQEVTNGYSPTSPSKEKIKKRIEVDVATFKLSYYFGDTLLDTILVSTGRPGYPTPKGHFTVMDKVPVKNYGGPGFGFWLPNTKWNLHFDTIKYRYYIHGAYWHNLFGIKNVSSGCVNVRYSDMERLYNFADVGTDVYIK